MDNAKRGRARATTPPNGHHWKAGKRRCVALSMGLQRGGRQGGGGSPSTNASTVVRPSWRRDSLTVEQFLAPARKIGRGAHGRGGGKRPSVQPFSGVPCCGGRVAACCGRRGKPYPGHVVKMGLDVRDPLGPDRRRVVGLLVSVHNPVHLGFGENGIRAML